MGQRNSLKPAADEKTGAQPGSPHPNQTSQKAPLKWFTRGWTLQELIAPRKMKFFDADWTMRGTKSDSAVVKHLSRITGVPSEVLGKDGPNALQRICVGQRMSWAAHRECSRDEDIAYCLLGLFQVNMPMLYGEGTKAFLRLQEEIVKYSTDLSIFAWTEHRLDENKQDYRGILSRHPREYSRLKSCRLLETQFNRSEEFVMTNRGLRFNISLMHPKAKGQDSSGLSLMDLGCLINGKLQGIFVQKMTDFYVRIVPTSRIDISVRMRRSEPSIIYIARDMDRTSEHNYKNTLTYGVKVQLETHCNSHHLNMPDAWPSSFFDPLKLTFLASGIDLFTGFGKVAITDSTISTSERRRVGDFLLVVVFNLTEFRAYILEGEQAVEFETFAQSTWSMDNATAENYLREFLRSSSNQAKFEITVTDGATNSTLRVAVKRRIMQWRTCGFLVYRKAVRVELSLVETEKAKRRQTQHGQRSGNEN